MIKHLQAGGTLILLGVTSVLAIGLFWPAASQNQNGRGRVELINRSIGSGDITPTAVQVPGWQAHSARISVYASVRTTDPAATVIIRVDWLDRGQRRTRILPTLTLAQASNYITETIFIRADSLSDVRVHATVTGSAGTYDLWTLTEPI